MHQPRQTYLVAVKRILRCLKDTPQFGTLINKSQDEHLYDFSDADWAGFPDNRRSTTGMCILWSKSYKLGNEETKYSFKV